jgi:hypothetical protein
MRVTHHKTKLKEKKKMQMNKNKTITILIAILLTSTIGASMLLTPTTSAHTPAWQIPTFAYVQAVIDPVGVGQNTYIYMWIDKTFGTDTALTNDWRFHNYRLTITKPDGSTEVKTWDIIWDTTSSQGYSFAPDQVGTYQFKFEFPGQAYTQYSHNPNSAFVNDTYLPSSATGTLTVQEEEIQYLPDPPLPTEYWNRPIYGENPNWWMVSSNWFGSGSTQLANWRSYIPDGVGPQTNHIMWSKQLQLSGGVVGGNTLEIEGDTFFEGSAYLNRFVNPIIIDGKIFYKEPLSYGDGDDGPEKCVDLRTGEVYWSRTDMLKPSFGFVIATHNPQQHGVTPPFLVATSGTTWIGYDADTGNWVWNITNIPSGGRRIHGPNGEYLNLYLTNLGTSSNPNYVLRLWNSSRFVVDYSGNVIRPFWTGVFNGSDAKGIEWEVPITWRNTMPNNPSIIAAYYDDLMLCYNGTLPNSGFRTSAISTAPYTYFAVNLDPTKGTVGSILWMKNFDPIIQNITVIQGGNDPVNGVFIEKLKETNQWAAINMRTGDRMWGPVGDQIDLDYYGNPGHEQVYSHIAYGKVYASGYSGIIYCYDEMTGQLLWSYGNGGEGNSTNSGFAVPGHYPTAINAIANGIIYTVTTEHTIQTPIYKGSTVRAINATDGTEIWQLSANTAEFNEMASAVADGYFVYFNGYDNKIYSLGKGPSQTTVTAPNLAAAEGQKVVIRGTVTDISAGTKLSDQTARFPNGVACASDESMKDWMEYVYMQQPMPTVFTGVPVTIDVIDSNGNYRTIGSATTDASGTFSLSWLPDIPGDYTVIVTFQGTQGYWPSYAETSFVVDPAHPTSAPTDAPEQSASEMYFVPAVAGIIVTIIVVGAILALLLLRKRP